MIWKHSARWSAVSARQDVDGACPTIVYTPNRQDGDPRFNGGEEERLELEMTPPEARKLARALNKAARRLA